VTVSWRKDCTPRGRLLTQLVPSLRSRSANAGGAQDTVTAPGKSHTRTHTVDQIDALAAKIASIGARTLGVLGMDHFAHGREDRLPMGSGAVGRRYGLA
jgi:hypothetical protein